MIPGEHGRGLDGAYYPLKPLLRTYLRSLLQAFSSFIIYHYYYACVLNITSVTTGRSIEAGTAAAGLASRDNPATTKIATGYTHDR